jgi:translocation and assembly module TamB
MSWKRVIPWIFGGLAVLAMVLLVAGSFILRSQKFHDYVLKTVAEKANQATGGRVELGSYSVQLSPIAVTVDRIVVHGSEPAGALPLFQADRLQIGLKIVSLFRRKIDLRALQLERPVVNLIVDKAGRSNIPIPPNASKSQGSTNIWDLGIQHVLLENGAVYYNQQLTPLTAELRDLATRVDYNSIGQRYDGSLSYARGRLQMRGYRPLAHSLQAKFNANPAGANLESLTLSLGASRATLKATLSNYAQPSLSADYHVFLHTADFRAALGNPSLPEGDVELNGSLHYQDVPGRPMLDTASLRGQLFSRALDVSTPQLRSRISSLRADYALANNTLDVRRLQADLLGGRLLADLTVRDVAGTRTSELRASLQRVSLDAARRALRNTSASVPLAGTLGADAVARWHGAMQDLLADLNGSIAAQTTGSAARAGSVPVSGTFHAVYDAPHSLITVRQTQLRTPGTVVTANGTLGSRSNLLVNASTSNLHGLVTLAAALQKPAPGKPVSPPPNIAGAATLNARVQGSMNRPQITGQLAAQNLQVEDTRWKSLNVGLAASPSRLELHDGTLVSAVKGNVHFALSVGLRNWAYAPSSPLSANVAVNQLPSAMLARAARVNTPITGDLSARINVHGSQNSPFGNGWVQLSKASLMDFAITQMTLRFQGNGDAIQSNLQLNSPAGNAATDLTFHPRTQAYVVRFSAPQVNLDKIPRMQQMQVAGVLSVSAQGQGTLKDPQLNLSAVIPRLSLRQKPVSNVKLNLAVAQQRANINLDSDIAQAYVRARGTVALTGDKQSDLRLDTSGIALGALLATYAPGQSTSKLNGDFELHATASGPLAQPRLMQAHLEIPRLALQYQQYQLSEVAPIRADYSSGMLRLQPAELRGTNTVLKLEGAIPVNSTAPASFSANGSVDLAILQMFTTGISSSGKVNLAVHGAGPTSAPGIRGQITIVDASFASSSAPIGVSHLNSTLAVSNTRISVQQFTADSGGGTLTATGFIDYRPALAINLGLQGKGIRILYPDGVRTVISSNLQLVGDASSSSLTGRVLLNSLSFTPSFDLSTLTSLSGGEGSSSPPSAFEQNMKLNVNLQSAGEFQATSSQVSLAGLMNLRLIGTAANPVIVGRADLTSGEMFFMNRRYEIQRAVMTFNNPNRTVPDLNVVVTTVVNQYNVNITLRGTPDRLETSYVSDPPLPPVDVINLIARGQTTEEQAASPGNLGANQLIASGLAGQVGGTLQKLTGISSLQIDPTIGGNNTNPGARLAIQQRVTKNFFFTFATDVTSTQDETVQLEYQFNPRWSASAVRDQYGNMGVDAKFHTRF